MSLIHRQKKHRNKLIALGFCMSCGRSPAGPQSQTRCESCRIKDNQRNKLERTRLKARVFAAYGPICICCKENELKFLTLDHVAGNGNQHRKEARLFGDTFYRWVIKSGFPRSLQVLCYNCNCGRYRNEGTCPHETNRGAQGTRIVSNDHIDTTANEDKPQ